MSAKHKFFIVDVFAEESYSGNQLAVVVSTEKLTTKTMQLIAAEMNFSETTFVESATSDEDNGYCVRIFTPSKEIDFAGHPLLGTAWVIRHHIAPKMTDLVLLNISIGQIPISFETHNNGKMAAWFLAPPMSLEEIADPEKVAFALGLSTEDIDPKTPIQTISAGTSAMIVPLRNMDALQRSKFDLDNFRILLNEGFPPLLYLYCNETLNKDNDLSVRFFFEAHGVREDPATGNGAAFLGAYLLEHQSNNTDDISIRIEQGYQMRRPSLIMMKARMHNDVPKIKVGGYVIEIVEGALLN